MKGININEVRPYVSKHETDKDSPTVWKLGVLDGILKSAINDNATTYEINKEATDAREIKTTLNVKQTLIDNVRFGLRGFENFIDPQTNEPIEFKTVSVSMAGRKYEAIPDEILKMIDWKVLMELAIEIDKETKLEKEEEKN